MIMLMDKCKFYTKYCIHVLETSI